MTLLTTERTKIDRITMQDASFFLELVNSPDWLRFIGDRGVSGVDDAKVFLQTRFLQSCTDNGFGYYVVRIAQCLTPIGICGFLRKPELQNPDFGFAFLPRYFGQGYAFESCRTVLNYGNNEFSFRTLDAVTRPDNLRSIRLLTRLGFLEVGRLNESPTSENLVLYRWTDTGSS